MVQKMTAKDSRAIWFVGVCHHFVSGFHFCADWVCSWKLFFPPGMRISPSFSPQQPHIPRDSLPYPQSIFCLYVQPIPPPCPLHSLWRQVGPPVVVQRVHRLADVAAASQARLAALQQAVQAMMEDCLAHRTKCKDFREVRRNPPPPRLIWVRLCHRCGV